MLSTRVSISCSFFIVIAFYISKKDSLPPTGIPLACLMPILQKENKKRNI